MHGLQPALAKDQGFYDGMYDHDWAAMKRFAPMARHTRRWIHKLLAQVERIESVADFGCGEGSLLQEIGQNHPQARLYGFDFSPVAASVSSQRLPQAKIVTHDIREPTNPFDEVVDVGISSEVLEHLEDDVAAIRNMACWCRYLIVTVPGGRLDEMARGIGHLRHYDATDLSRAMQQSGLKVLYARAWGFPFAYPWYARLRNAAGSEAVTGHYGPAKRLVAQSFYRLFFLNDLFSGGNKVFLLARTSTA